MCFTVYMWNITSAAHKLHLIFWRTEFLPMANCSCKSSTSNVKKYSPSFLISTQKFLTSSAFHSELFSLLFLSLYILPYQPWIKMFLKLYIYKYIYIFSLSEKYGKYLSSIYIILDMMIRDGGYASVTFVH